MSLCVLAAGCPPVGCEDGEVLTAGGDCVPGEIVLAEWEEGVIDGAMTRECELKEPNGDLDFVNACALGGCIGDTYQELLDVWGVGVECSPFSYTIGTERRDRIGCDWSNGLGMHFDIEGNNPEPTDTGDVFTIEAPFQGTTESGLGIGVSMGCFVQELGAPRNVFFDDDTLDPIPSSIIIDNDNAHVSLADQPPSGGDVSDGYVDRMLVFGAVE